MQERIPPSAADKQQLWRGCDFASISELQDWLKDNRLSREHEEPAPWAGGSYLHPGYEAFRCESCGRPSIKARGNRDVRRCGRHECTG